MTSTRHVPDYEKMPASCWEDVKKSFELAYGSVLGRCWMEVRKLWLEYISYSTSSILCKAGKPAHIFSGMSTKSSLEICLTSMDCLHISMKMLKMRIFNE